MQTYQPLYFGLCLIASCTLMGCQSDNADNTRPQNTPPVIVAHGAIALAPDDPHPTNTSTNIGAFADTPTPRRLQPQASEPHELSDYEYVRRESAAAEAECKKLQAHCEHDPSLGDCRRRLSCGGGNPDGGIEHGGDKSSAKTYSARDKKIKFLAVLRPASPTVSNGYDGQVVKRIINQQKKHILNCYQRQLDRDPTLTGTITIQWLITKNGFIKHAKIESNDMGNDDVAQCIVQQIQSWTFSAGNETTVSFPFVFEAR